MKVKTLELRDKGTFVALLAVDMNPSYGPDKIPNIPLIYAAQRYLLRRVGYPCDDRPNILITKLSADGGKASNDPYYWDDRTFSVGHNYIIENWSRIRDGDVIDVEHILGETPAPKTSERFA